jgi:hypothetical protein
MICACGKEKNDGVRCKYGAAHVSLKESQKQFRPSKGGSSDAHS